MPSSPSPDAARLASHVETPTPSGIAATLARLISAGTLAPGERLPTVRDLAAELGVSPATISSAWQALAAAGQISARGRAGTFVRDAAGTRLAPHTRRLAGHVAGTRLDLSRGTPDPALLPRLARAFAGAAEQAGTTSYHDEPVVPRLRALLQERWPAPEHRLTIVDGALDAIDRILSQVTRYGDRIVLECPGFPQFFDLAEALGLDVLPIGLDESGALPAELEQALRLGPRAVILQPRGHNPTGASLTAVRAAELADVVRSSRRGADVLIIEDEHSADITRAADANLAALLPHQVVHVRSFSKSHGPDLRIAALGGRTDLVAAIETRRMLGPAWTPRLLQHVLAELLTDPASIAEVALARAAYADRQRRFASALERRLGAPQPIADGINAWVPVADERAATVALAAAGIRVAGGGAFFPHGVPVAPDGRDRIRVTIGVVPDDVAAVAAAVADAAG